MEESMDDVDLYGDLDSSIFHTAANPNYTTRVELLNRNAELESLLQKAELQIKELTAKLKKSEKSYVILQRNSICLEATAKTELERKNGQIAKLGREYQELAKKIRPTWNKELNCPEITRPDLQKMTCLIQEACAESGDIKTDRIRQYLSLQVQQVQATPKEPTPKLISKRSDSMVAHKISFENMDMYFYQEQCNFQRKERVEFPQKVKPPININYAAEVPHNPVPEDVYKRNSMSSKACEVIPDNCHEIPDQELGVHEASDTARNDNATTPCNDEDIKSLTPDLAHTTVTPVTADSMEGSSQHNRRGSREDSRHHDDEDHRRLSGRLESGRGYNFKRQRSSSRERASRYPRRGDRQRDYEYNTRDYHHRTKDRRRYDTRR
jgi:hypothetical protein